VLQTLLEATFGRPRSLFPKVDYFQLKTLLLYLDKRPLLKDLPMAKRNAEDMMPFHERLALTHFVPGKLLISETTDDLRRMCLYVGCLPKCDCCKDWTHPMYYDTVLKTHLCLRC